MNRYLIKQVDSLEETLNKCGLKDSFVISTHHYLGNADGLAMQLFSTIKKMGVKNIVWFPSDTAPCHDELIQFLEDGTIKYINGSLRGQLGKYCSEGKMNGIPEFRSYQGRINSIISGDVKIDIALIASPIADKNGNATGMEGKSACGTMLFAQTEANYANKVVVITDNLADETLKSYEISGDLVDYIFFTRNLTNGNRVMSKQAKVTQSPTRRLIAENTVGFLTESGILQNNKSLFFGTGGTQQAVLESINSILTFNKWNISLGVGEGSHQTVKMLQKGTLKKFIDIQPYDESALKSLQNNPNHMPVSPEIVLKLDGLKELFSQIDIMVLGAIQVDLEFNANVITQSDGRVIAGMRYWQECLSAKNVLLVLPLFRDRVPGVVEKLNSVCGLGTQVAAVVTEYGVAVNPERNELIEKIQLSGIQLKTMEELKNIAELICGVPEKATFQGKEVAKVKHFDGKLLSSVHSMHVD